MRPALAAVLAGGAAAVLLAASVLLSDGSSDDRLAWIGAGAVLAAGAGVVGVLWGRLGMPALSRRGWIFLSLLAAFVVWNGISVLWSIEPDRSWNYFNRGLVYLGLALVGVFVGSYVRGAVVLLAGALAVVFAAAVGWGLLVKAVPALDAYGGRIARLNAPIGYWNGLALLIDMALPLALWLAARREHHPALRAGATAFLFAGVTALLLTYSRAGIAVGVLAVGLWFLLGRPKLEGAVAFALGGPAGVGVALWAFSRPGLANDREPYSVRFHDGIWFAVVLVVVGVAVAAVAYFLARLDQRKPLSGVRREAAGRLALTALVVVLLAAGALLVARGAGPSRLLHDFTQSASPKVGNSPSRIIVFSSSSRSAWWRESWRAFKAHPVNGTGTGSFELTDRRYRKTRGLALEPHSLPLQFLSETGIVGFLLGAGATVAGLLAIFDRRRREGREAAAAAALAVVPIAYLLHTLLDFDWDFLAVTGPLFLVMGVLITRDAPARQAKPRPLWAAGTALVAAAAIYSLVAPWLATRKVDDAFAALGRGSPRAAVADASAAHDLNPLALEPLFAWAAAETLLGHDVEAEKLYMRAVRLQPLNPRSWFELGRFELARGNARQGRVFLHRAAQLDPQGPAKTYR
jgi:hypothetical protein